MERNKEHRGNILLGSDQRSREHALKVLGSLVIMPACMVTLVLETGTGGLRTLMNLLTLTLLCSDIITDQRFRKKEWSMRKRTLMGWGDGGPRYWSWCCPSHHLARSY